jgi:hypothetical protein
MPACSANSRNIDFISRLTPRWMAMADGISTASAALMRRACRHRARCAVESNTISIKCAALQMERGFALKPASGSQGNGIVLISGLQNDRFRLVDGQVWNYARLREHVREITRGLHSSGDEPDRALFEELIRPDPFSRAIAPEGIADIRVLLVRGKPVAAMLRVPTRMSAGKANLHQGAAGFAVDITNGRLGGGVHEGRLVSAHPDSGEVLVGREIPHCRAFWKSLVPRNAPCRSVTSASTYAWTSGAGPS